MLVGRAILKEIMDKEAIVKTAETKTEREREKDG